MTPVGESRRAGGFTSRRLEYHLLGNHYLQTQKHCILRRAVLTAPLVNGGLDRRKLLTTIKRTILDDGGHFELTHVSRHFFGGCSRSN